MTEPEFRADAARRDLDSPRRSFARTLVEKIFERHAVGRAGEPPPREGDLVQLRPAHVLSHDNSSAILEKFHAWGGRRVRDAGQPVFVLDHDIQNEGAANLAKYARIEAFAREQGIAFYPKGRGIGHQVLVEEGFVRPGTLVVAADSHANLYGALAALGTPVARTDAAAIWATGSTWWEVPRTARVVLEGKLRPGVTGKDVILALCAGARRDAEGSVVEFAGDGVGALSMDARLTIANMTTEWGATAGIFPFDETLREFLSTRAGVFAAREDASPRLTKEGIAAAWDARLSSDPEAPFDAVITLDLASVSPHVAGPNDVAAGRPLSEVAALRIPIQKAYILSCVNARFEDLAAAAEVLRGRRVASGVELYLAAASAEVQREAESRGVWSDLLAAGAIPLPSGCGPCIGLGRGTLAAGETGISATNRNYAGRMGDRGAVCYLANPAVVAASALAGYITGPEGTTERPRIEVIAAYAAAGSRGSQAHGAPASPLPSSSSKGPASVPIEGELVFLSKDDLDTDGIWPGTLTYRDDVLQREMAAAVFRNYEPRFAEIARAGDILVVGRNFGIGSSREQATTALRAFGIAMVVARTAAPTYKRNAWNNGLALLEFPAFVEAVREAACAACGGSLGDARVIRTGRRATIDLARGTATLKGAPRDAGDAGVADIVFSFPPLSSFALKLLLRGGLEELVRQELTSAGSGHARA